jgi:hypothetical protein
MFTKHNMLRLIVFALLSLSLLGCASSARLIEVNNVPNQKWRITSVLVSETKNGWRVSGRLNAPNIFGLPDGHILVSILSEDGTILGQKTANYRRVIGYTGRHRRHQFGVALFSVDFESIVQGAKVVTEHRIQKPKKLHQQ